MSNQRLKRIVVALWLLVLLGAAALALSGALGRLIDLPDSGPTADPAAAAAAESGTPPQSVGPLPAAATPPDAYLVPGLPASLPTPGLDALNPLTGLAPADPQLLERRPVAVKVVNYPRSMRPDQSGLTLADVVFEYYIEDGISRYIAVFYGSDARRAGPVRSGRFFDEHVMRMYQAVLVFANMDDRVQDYFLKTPDLQPYLIVPRDDNCPPLCRDEAIQGFNNVFVDTSRMDEWLVKAEVDNARPALRSSFHVGSIAPWTAPEANRVHVRYSAYAYGRWDYDAALGRYVRYQDTRDALNGAGEGYAPLLDALNGQPVATDNLVVLFVEHTYYNRDDQVFKINLLRSGAAFLFREGRAYPATWLRSEMDQPLVLTDPQGNLLSLKPGSTFFEVLSLDTTYVQENDTWQFQFVLPP